MSSRVRKYSDGLSQKQGPIKATLPVSSLLKSPLNIKSGPQSTLSVAFSPERIICGQRSPGAFNYRIKSDRCSSHLRRTASLDTLNSRTNQNFCSSYIYLQWDKSTQTDESYLDRSHCADNKNSSELEVKSEKVLRQRVYRAQKGENSVSSQTLSPAHSKANPMMIPSLSHSAKPLRNSIEGLNQEIEKLVLLPGQPHNCRPDSHIFSVGTPEGRKAPLIELLQGDYRSVNTQTPIGELLGSDESHSNSPDDDGSSLPGASPRINRFMARNPPDGCEKVNLKSAESRETSNYYKPCCIGFNLQPSSDSAFQPLQSLSVTSSSLGDLRTDN